MKKRAMLALVLVVALALASCGGTTTESDGTTKIGNVRLATGGNTGTYYAFGTAVAQVLGEKTTAKFNVQSTGASKANIQLIADGEVEIAIVQNDVMDYAYNGTELFDGETITEFSALGACYAEVCQIIADPTAGISSIEDLKGKKVSVGDAGSGVEFNAKQILEAYGITFEDIDKQNLSFGDSADAFKDDKIDAFFCTAGAPTTAVMDLATSNAITVLTIDDAHAQTLIDKYPFYTQYTISKDTYTGMEADAVTVAVKATFIVSNEMSEDAVYELTKALFENQADIAIAHAKGEYLDAQYAVEGVSVPFHPGAEKYYKEVGVM